MAIWNRKRTATARCTTAIPAAQYTAIRYTDRLAEAGFNASIGTVGDSYDSYDNAMAESVNGLYKAELVRWEGPWHNASDLELATLGYIDWFNNTRIPRPWTTAPQPKSRPTTTVNEPSTSKRSWGKRPSTKPVPIYCSRWRPAAPHRRGHHPGRGGVHFQRRLGTGKLRHQKGAPVLLTMWTSESFIIADGSTFPLPETPLRNSLVKAAG